MSTLSKYQRQGRIAAVFASLRAFIQNKTPSRREALSSLRLIFVLSFFGQLVFVMLFGTVMLLVAGKQTDANVIVSQVLVFLGLFQLPLGFIISTFSARAGGKGGALSAVISLGVILSTPAWYTLFAWLIGSSNFYLLVLMMMVMLYYALGFVLSGHYVKMAITPKDTEILPPDETAPTT